MGKRTRKHKKQFSCGHKGFGQQCYRCIDQNLKGELATLAHQQEKQAWSDSFEADLIDLRGLPRVVVLKSRQILRKLLQGECYRQFRGKRFRFDRHLITIPITYHYRLLCRDEGKKLIPLQVLSHEDYNPIARNKTSKRYRC